MCAFTKKCAKKLLLMKVTSDLNYTETGMQKLTGAMLDARARENNDTVKLRISYSVMFLKKNSTIT